MRLIKITTYRELTKVVAAFSAEDSQMGSLVIVGAPGTGPPEQPGVPLIWSSDDLKSFTMQETVKLPH